MRKTPDLSSRSEYATELLRRRIINGQSEPGSLLAEVAVARELGVSRVPVREALFTLERDGLVEFSVTGRAYVKVLSPRDFEELYVLRLTLEPAAARLAAPTIRVNPRVLEKNISATARAKSILEVTRLDLEFHEIIIEASGNGRLLKLWRSMLGELDLWLGRLHRQHQGQRLDTRDETVAAHRKLLECFLTQSPSVCERKMRDHIQGWREWLPVLSENE
jgi:DNA-binding GntR family transcriptional regulator